MKEYQLLISTLNKDARTLCEKNNIDSDAIIINQKDCNSYECFEMNGYSIEEYGFSQRGIGLSREMALNLSSAEIIQFTDDDVVFEEGYRDIILSEMKKHPEADAIIFTDEILKYSRGDEEKVKRIMGYFHRIGLFEATFLRMVCCAIRSERLRYYNIHFNTLLGNKEKYKSGEDTGFLCDMIRAGMRVYVSPIKIATTDFSESTWYNGKDNAYFVLRGSAMAAIFPKSCWLAAFLKAIKNRKHSSFKEVYKSYLQGIKEYKSHL